jgi:hypothetical protein
VVQFEKENNHQNFEGSKREGYFEGCVWIQVNRYEELMKYVKDNLAIAHDSIERNPSDKVERKKHKK